MQNPFFDEHDKIHRHHHNYLFPEFFRFSPWYDDRADYHTNAKSYYDYLSRYNKVLSEIIELLNRVAERNLTAKDTKTIELIKNGDWINNKDSVIELLANVKLSSQEKNRLEIKEDGLFSKNYDDEIKAIKDDITSKYNDIISKLQQLSQELANSNITINNLKNRLNTIERDFQKIPKVEGKKTTTNYSIEIAGQSENPDIDLFSNSKTLQLEADITEYKYIEFFYHEGSTYSSARFPTTITSDFGITVTNILDGGGKPFLVKEIHLSHDKIGANTQLEINFISYLNQNGEPVNIYSKGNVNGINVKPDEAKPPVIYKIDLIKEVVHE